MKNIFKGIRQAIVISVLVLITFIFFTIYQANKVEELPDFLGVTPLIVLSNSMKPHLESGDLTFIKRMPLDSKIKVGDVVTFRQEDVLITHRVIDIVMKNGEIGLVTQGDNNNSKDEKVILPEQFIGKEAFVIPKVGLFTNFISSPFGFFLLLIIPFSGYITLSVYQMLMRSEEKEVYKIKGD
ncbi:MAG: signal peptidase I [Bacillota bacterium]